MKQTKQQTKLPPIGQKQTGKSVYFTFEDRSKLLKEIESLQSLASDLKNKAFTIESVIERLLDQLDKMKVTA